ncbi:GyrI-like domain-containing protein [Paenibacillus sp. SCIV0701]|uniref:GyrI-like domain-containing protein n=2 Tax=Paenibacillus soyae TaxID=2969249 RepID=A0A9X2MUC2_9BACL|nr:GyrI-like domain-containing protein [Paenibacillus soyae]
METRIESLPDYRIAYVRQVGPYGAGNVRAMEELKSWAEVRGMLVDSAILFGIPQDDPRLTEPDRCRYDACIVIPEQYESGDAIHTGRFLGGQYAVITVKHTAEDVQKAWSEIIPAIISSGYQVDNKPIIERYTGGLLKQHLCEICVPVTKL